MRTQNWFILLGVLVILVIGGNYLYTYLKEKPPTALVELVTKTDPPPPLPEGDIAPFTPPEGFSATIFSRDVPGARVMVRDSEGTMLVSETAHGKVVALPDQDADGKSDRTVTVLEGLTQPHGLALHCPDGVPGLCVLYVAETGELKSYTYDPATFKATYEETLATFPTGSGHFTRALLMHPDGKQLLISVGSSCNVCIEDDPHRATVLALDLATKELSVVATGLRNTVFMAVDPRTEEIWGTDNGRDILGDDIPPDEVNRVEEGKNYGWPICYGNNIHDTDFDEKKYLVDPCTDATPPHIELQAHSAPLGLGFIPDEGWPEDMRGDLLIAYHGSWNRSTPTGYKVVRFDLDTARNATGAPIDFLTGFLPSESDTDNAMGRPVDVLAEPGGVVYVSDDRAGAIYRIKAEAPVTPIAP
jgi:glucose/arabinose dehydrogenase